MPSIDELPKMRKLANKLQFLLDMRDCELSILRDLVAVCSFDELMKEEDQLMNTLDYCSMASSTSLVQVDDIGSHEDGSKGARDQFEAPICE